MFNMQAFYNNLVGASQEAGMIHLNESTAVSTTLPLQQLFHLTYLTRQDLDNVKSALGWKSWFQTSEEAW